MNPRKLLAVGAATAGLVLGLASAPAEAKAPAQAKAPARPYEAIAGHYPTLAEAQAVAAKAKAKGVRTVIQKNRPGHIEVEYGNGWSSPGPASSRRGWGTSRFPGRSAASYTAPAAR